jgi:hypothetical protein
MFEFGDDESYANIADRFMPGKTWAVLINGRQQFRGRAEVLSGVGTFGNGGAMRVQVRTKLSDARYASAKTSTKVNDVSISDFIVDMLGQIGIPKSQISSESLAWGNTIKLTTGGSMKGGAAPKSLEPLQINQAKVQPGEPVYEAITRHLERYGLLLLEDPQTGGVIISAPNTDAEPSYVFRSKRGRDYVTKGNNLSEFERVIDWTDSPREVVVYGQTFGADVEKSTLFGRATNPDVERVFNESGEFARRVVMVFNQLKNKEQAEGRARREMAAMRRREDGWVVTVDGASYLGPQGQILYYPNTTATVECDITGGRVGYNDKHLIHKVTVRGNMQTGITTRLEMTRADILDLRA